MSATSASGRKLKGRVVAVEKTDETVRRDGETWKKCVFTLEVVRFSNRTPEEVVPPYLRGKTVKVIRYCLYNWHYRLGIEKTLSSEETESLLSGKQTSTISW
jgi:hypothetical protein